MAYLLRRGPRENRFRPAVDPLFRTAAISCGPRAIGVVLSGALDDGTHGLGLIKDHGGVAIAQDPAEALVPGMPLNAIQNVEVDYILKASDIARRLPRLITERIDRQERLVTPKEPDVAELRESRMLRYRCHVGHGHTAASLVADQSDGVENALWSALRALEEQSMLRRRMADDAHRAGDGVTRREYEREARELERRASDIRRLLQRERPREVSHSAVGRVRTIGASGARATRETTANVGGRLVEAKPGTRTRRVNQ